MDLLLAALVAYPFAIVIGAILSNAKKVRHGPAYWLWQLLVCFPIAIVLWSQALDWPWWGAALYFAGIMLVGFLVGVIRGVQEATEVA